MSEREHDSLNRFLFEHLPVRGELVRLDATWREVLQRYDYPPRIRELLGQTMAATALLAATIKFQGRITVQMDGDGPVRMLVVQCNEDFHLRGLAHGPEHGGDPGDDESLVGRARLVITIEPEAQSERYQGVVEVDGDEIAGAVETYFARSEQLPTRLWLAADGESAAGMLLQNVPGPSEDADGWPRTVQLADTVSAAELQRLPATQLLRRLFHEEDLRLFEARPVSFRCSCSRARIESVLLAMGRDEAEQILAEEGSVRVTCEFCNRRYELDAVDVAQLFAADIRMPPPDTRQ